MAQPSAGRVLVVDDDAAVVTVLTLLLGRRGYIVETADTCAQAKERAGSVGYDVALVDVGLRDGCGAALAAELEQRYGLEQRVIVMTGGHAPRQERCMLKPFNYGQLLQVVDEVAGQGAPAGRERAESAAGTLPESGASA